MTTKLPDLPELPRAWWRSWELCQECPDNQSKEGAASAAWRHLNCFNTNYPPIILALSPISHQTISCAATQTQYFGPHTNIPPASWNFKHWLILQQNKASEIIVKPYCVLGLLFILPALLLSCLTCTFFLKLELSLLSTLWILNGAGKWVLSDHDDPPPH